MYNLKYDNMFISITNILTFPNSGSVVKIITLVININ